MDSSEARQSIIDVDDDDREQRTQRLVELSELLPDDGLVGINGTAAQFLFEDVKATWIYGCFAATVVASYAFCMQQLAGTLRMFTDLPSDNLPPTLDLENLGLVAMRHSLITSEQHARLVELQDRAEMYLAVSLGDYHPQLERHMLDVAQHLDENSLLEDARHALSSAVALLILRD